MKKSPLIVAFVFLSLASCKKNRTCVCTVTDYISQQEDIQKTILKNVTKKQAQKECSDLQSSNINDCHLLSSYY